MASAAVSYRSAVSAELVREETIGDLLRQAVRAAPEVCALVEGVAEPAARRRWSYQELFAEAEAAAGALLTRFRPGERIAVWANNIPEWTILQLATALAGTLNRSDDAIADGVEDPREQIVHRRVGHRQHSGYSVTT